MSKAIPCLMVYNTTWGYIMQPVKFNSIKEAIADARIKEMPYRLYNTHGKLIKQGWL